MKTQNLLLIIGLLLCSNIVFGQELAMLKDEENTDNKSEAYEATFAHKQPKFEFYSYQLQERLDEVNSTTLKQHFLGESTARRLVLMNNEYKQMVQIAPGSPATKVLCFIEKQLLV